MTAWIGICGRARAGKTAAARAMAARARGMGRSCQVYEIGQLVLEECIRLGKIANKMRDDLIPAELAVLIEHGRIRRAERADYWTDKIEASANCDQPDVALIPNIRHWNELAWLKSKGGVLVKVRRRNADGSPHIARDRDPNDETETQQVNFIPDFELVNGGLELLRRQAGVLVEFMLTGGAPEELESELEEGKR